MFDGDVAEGAVTGHDAEFFPVALGMGGEPMGREGVGGLGDLLVAGAGVEPNDQRIIGLQPLITSLASQSNHPVSIAITQMNDQERLPISNFDQIVGKGIEGECNGSFIKIGKATFVDYPIHLQNENASAYATINEEPAG